MRSNKPRLVAQYLMVVQCLAVVQSSVSAQTVQSDHTTGTVVVSGSDNFNITEGSVRNSASGTTLFHSFDTFSPAGNAAIFDLRDSQNGVNTDTVSAIISRVTGDLPSFIDGGLSVLQDSGTPAPDLFLINPQGILFGEGASLSLPGSFVASTAESLLFEQGISFSAVNPEAVPLLTVSAPVGLQFGGSAAGITIQGGGHAVASANPSLAQYSSGNASSGLNVAAGNRISLLGGEVTTTGGVINAASGRIDIGSVRRGTVSMSEDTIAYEAVEQFGDIDLSMRSLVSTSGSNPGSIHLRGRQIRLSDGSLVWSQNEGSNAAGEISAVATEKILLTGATPTVDAVSGIITEALGTGDAGSIAVISPQLSVEAGAALGSRSFNVGDSGRVDILAEQANISGYVPAAPNIFSFVGTANLAGGADAEVSASLGSLTIYDGGYLGSSTLGSGQGSDVTVVADTIEVAGVTPALIASNIGATAVGEFGTSGDITLTTRTLSLQRNGLVSTSSISVADAGNISVDASERIDIIGAQDIPGLPPSTIASTVDLPPIGIRQLLGLPNIASGNAGSVSVSTPILNISDGGAVTVANLIDGNAGQVQVNADTVTLRSGIIDALTETGEGGNIDLTVRDVLLLRDGASVSAIALGNGNGGNINIDAPTIVGLENSDIEANAVQGNGGNISIETRGLFGLTAQAQPTDESDITASSQFGLSGTVSVNNLTIQSDAGLVELSNETVDLSTQIAKGCNPSRGNQFIASGRGGLPVSPTAPLTADSVWIDLRPTVENRGLAQGDRIQPIRERALQSSPAQALASQALVEASSWQQDSQGQITLISQPTDPEMISAHAAVDCLSVTEDQISS